MDENHSSSFDPRERVNPYDRPEFQHDGYFRLTMQDLSFAREFLLWAVPELKETLLNFDTLERMPDTFQDSNLNPSSADILFRAFLKGTDSEKADGEIPPEFNFCVFFLVEHKSRSERRTAFQILRYITRVWDEWLKNNEKNSKAGEPLLPFILPIIFYHGKNKYRGPANIRDSIYSIPELKKYLPDWSFCLIDVSQVSEDQLPENWKVRAFIRVTRAIFRSNLLDTFHIINEEIYPHVREPGAKEFRNAMIKYVWLSAASIRSEIIEEVSKMESFEDVEYDMLPWWKKEREAQYTALLEKRAEGHAEGLAEGHAEGLAEGHAEGLAEGLAKGETKGRAEGLAEGEARRAMKQLIFVLTKRFGDLPEETAETLKNIKEIAEIDRLFNLSLDIPTLAEFIQQIR